MIRTKNNQIPESTKESVYGFCVNFSYAERKYFVSSAYKQDGRIVCSDISGFSGEFWLATENDIFLPCPTNKPRDFDTFKKARGLVEFKNTGRSYETS